MTERKKRILTIAAAVILIAYPFVCSTALSEVSYTLESEKVGEGVRLAFISDVHNSRYGKDMCELVDSVKKYNPDAVIFGGDLYDEHWGDGNSDLLVERLASEYDCFYSIGNHEIWRGDSESLKQKMAQRGVTVLDGEYSDMEIKGNRVRFIGIEGISGTEEYQNALSAVSEDCYNVLINHYPEQFPEVSGKGFDLVLSGHAHGGQVVIPFVLNGVYAPNQGLFPEYAGGRYTENNTEMIVSRGLQRNILNAVIPRVFNRPEIVFIDVKGKA